MDVKRHQENPHLVWGDPAESIPPPTPKRKENKTTVRFQRSAH